MSSAAILFLALGGTAAILVSLPWLATRARRRGVGSALAPFEEIWHPAAYRSHVEIQVQDSRVTPAPSPGDPPGDAGPSQVPHTAPRGLDRPAPPRARGVGIRSDPSG